jgi:hypothetical protein
MVITLLPHQEKALEAALKAGVIHSMEEFVDSAIAHLPHSPAGTEATPLPAANEPEAKNLFELFAPIRGLLTDEEVDTLFVRNRSTSRPVDLS